MKINRILPYLFTTEVQDEETTQKKEKSFEEILQEEQEKLIRLLSDPENTENIKQIYFKYNPRMIDGLFCED